MELADQSFRMRVNNDVRLRAIVDMLRHQLHEQHVTVEDIVRCAVLACQCYFEEHHVPMTVLIKDLRRPR